jgi:hypothetical protein
MFVPYRVSLKEVLSFSDAGSDHDLFITFHSTFLTGRSLQRENADKTPPARGTYTAGHAGLC